MLHAFTRNYNDLSSDAGFQFEFHCDCCGNGYKSTFKESSTYDQRQMLNDIGRKAEALNNILGGKLGGVGWNVARGADAIKNRVDSRGPEWRREQEQAFDEAQEEVRPYFRKCPACNKWVCEDCWNNDENLCISCAPRESSYVAKARNEAMRREINVAVENSNVWHGTLEKRTTVCPNCGQPAGDGNFCAHCGASFKTKVCPNCGAPLAEGAKFCSKCGTAIAVEKTGICPNCGKQNDPSSAFCSGCGTKL